MLARVGHNSSAYGQMLTPVLPAAPKGPKQRFPYFKFYPRDWLEATRDLSLEQRGAYIDLICILMEMEGYLADNDKWISHQMHVSPRKWRGLKEDLVNHKKIAVQDGQITNERCLKELDALLSQRRNLADSAVKRERNKRETSVKLPGNNCENSEKLNENNEPETTVVPLRARVTDLDSDKDKKEPPIVPLEGDDQHRRKRTLVPEQYAEGFEAFWGLYPRKVGKGAAAKLWERLSMDQRRKAWRSLKAQLPALKAQMQDPRGNFCAHPATWLSQGRFDDDLSSSTPGAIKPEGMPDKIWAEIQAGQARERG